MSTLTKIRNRFKDPPGGTIKRHDLLNPAGLEFSETYIPGFGNVLPDVNDRLLEIKQQKQIHLAKHRNARSDTERLYYAEEYKDTKETEKEVKGSASNQIQQREKHAQFLAWAVGFVTEENKLKMAQEMAQRLGQNPDEAKQEFMNTDPDYLNYRGNDNEKEMKMFRPKYAHLVKGLDEEIMKIYDRHTSVITYLTKLQFKGPQNLYELKVYYKYFIDNNVFIKIDEWQRKYKVILGAKKYNLAQEEALQRKLNSIEEFEFIIWLYSQDIMKDCAVDIEAVIHGDVDPDDEEPTADQPNFVGGFSENNLPKQISTPLAGRRRRRLAPPTSTKRVNVRKKNLASEVLSPINDLGGTQQEYTIELPSESRSLKEYRNAQTLTDPYDLNYVHPRPLATMTDREAQTVIEKLDQSTSQDEGDLEGSDDEYEDAKDNLSNQSDSDDSYDSNESFDDDFYTRIRKIIREEEPDGNFTDLTRREQAVEGLINEARGPLLGQIVRLERELETQRAQMQDQRSTHNVAQTQYVNLQADNARITQRNEELQTASRQLETQIADLQRRYDDSANQLQDRQRQLDNAAVTFEASNNAKIELQKQVHEITRKFVSASFKTRRLETENGELQLRVTQGVEEAQRRIQNLEAEHQQNLLGQLRVLKETHDTELQQRLQAADDEHNRIIDTMRRENQAQSENLQKLQEENTETKKNRIKLLNAQKQATKTMQDEINKLKEDESNKARELAQVQAELQTNLQRINRDQTEIQQLQQNLSQLREQLNQLHAVKGNKSDKEKLDELMAQRNAKKAASAPTTPIATAAPVQTESTPDTTPQPAKKEADLAVNLSKIHLCRQLRNTVRSG
jgi:hypothetical protein